MTTISFPHCVFRFFKLFQEQEELFDILYGTISSICSIYFIANEYSIAYLVSGKACISPCRENGAFPGGGNELYLQNSTSYSHDAYRGHSTKD